MTIDKTIDVYSAIVEMLDVFKLDFFHSTALHLALAASYLTKAKIYHQKAVEQKCTCPMQHDKMLLAIDAAMQAFEDIADLTKAIDLKNFVEQVRVNTVKGYEQALTKKYGVIQ